MNYAFLIAGGLSAFALVLHIMLGRAHGFLPPKADEDSTDPASSKPSRPLHIDAWYGRHITSALLVVMTFGFAHAARIEASRDLALTLSILALVSAALRLGLALHQRAKEADAREWGLVAAIGVLGMIGLQL